MSSFYFFVCQIIVIVSSRFRWSSAMYSSKALEGYPAGYLSDCPNITTPQPISKNDLKNLYLVVHGAGSSKKIKYNYYQTGLLAKNPHIDWSKKTLVYVGGYLFSANFVDARLMELYYIRLGYNVLLVDELYFVVAVYPTVARLVRHVGSHVGEMLAELTHAGLLDPSKVEMVGISLGAHTMGYIAKKYKQLTGRKFSRLTGLDPSGPCFRNSGPENRLDETDADFVDVVLTNIDGYGIAAPIGHVNFYVNGGEYQIGVVASLPCTVFCSHVKSLFFWISALENQNDFIGIKCDSVQQARFRDCYDNVPQITNILGPKSDRKKPGIYYLSTKNTFPYYLGKKGLRKEYDFVRLYMNYIFKGL